MFGQASLNVDLEKEFAPVIGLRITGVRTLSRDELEFYGRDLDVSRPYALEIEGGTMLIVSREAEGEQVGELSVESVWPAAEQRREGRV
jgi:hypothetical protein